MFGLSWIELFIILVVALLVIGPDKLPEVARGLGRVIRQFQRIINDVRNSINMDEFEANVRESSHYTPPDRSNIPNPIAIDQISPEEAIAAPTEETAPAKGFAPIAPATKETPATPLVNNLPSDTTSANKAPAPPLVDNLSSDSTSANKNNAAQP